MSWPACVFTIPINLQDITGSHQPLRRVLVDSSSNDADTCYFQYMMIFRWLFTIVAKEFDSLASVTVTDPKPLQFACMWREHLKNRENRDRIYDEVAFMSGFFPMPFITVEAQTLSSLGTLFENLNRICVIDATQKIRIVVLYIHEAHELAVPFGPDNNPDGSTRIDTLCSVFDVFHAEPLFCLILARQLLLRRPRTFCHSCGGTESGLGSEPRELEEE
ncbi:hypothetical protein OG21DRAFT_849470 [Imleria badia]|nr:hypothetical protein OG21DRAFT_849470 [Imleria badia]